MSEGTKSDMWTPPSRFKMARIYMERDELKAEIERLRDALAVYANPAVYDGGYGHEIAAGALNPPAGTQPQPATQAGAEDDLADGSQSEGEAGSE